MPDEQTTKKYVSQWNRAPSGIQRWQFMYHDATKIGKQLEMDGEFAHVFPDVAAAALNEYGEGWIEV